VTLGCLSHIWSLSDQSPPHSKFPHGLRTQSSWWPSTSLTSITEYACPSTKPFFSFAPPWWWCEGYVVRGRSFWSGGNEREAREEEGERRKARGGRYLSRELVLPWRRRCYQPFLRISFLQCPKHISSRECPCRLLVRCHHTAHLGVTLGDRVCFFFIGRYRFTPHRIQFVLLHLIADGVTASEHLEREPVKASLNVGVTGEREDGVSGVRMEGYMGGRMSEKQGSEVVRSSRGVGACAVEWCSARV
jgi:hypothetical protein